MAPTIDATVGGASSNSYALRTVANTYFDERLQATQWTGTDVPERAMIEATRRLDQELYQGTKAASGQALKWPRVGAFDDDGEELASDALPEFLVHAMLELALYLFNQNTDDVDALAPTGLEPFEQAAAGPVSATTRASFKAGQLPENVKRLLLSVLETPEGSVRMQRA